MICASRLDSGCGREALGSTDFTSARLFRKTHGGLGAGKDRRAELGRSGSAVGQDPIEFARMAAELVEPLADRCDQSNHRIGKRGFEGAEALAGELAKDFIDAASRHR